MEKTSTGESQNYNLHTQFDSSAFLTKVQNKFKRDVPPPNAHNTFDFDEPEYKNYDYDHQSIIPNESDLYKFYPYLKNIEGSALAVGFDTLFDIIVNSNIRDGYFLDITPRVTLARRASMEIALKHKAYFGTFPNQNEYLSYFSEGFTLDSLEMLRPSFTESENKELKRIFTQKMNRELFTTIDNDDNAPLLLHHYFKFKMSDSRYSSWLASQQSMHLIFSLYEKNAFPMITGSLQGDTSMKKIGEKMINDKKICNLIYNSNARWIDSEDYEDAKNLKHFPITDKTLFLYTSPADLKSDLLTQPLDRFIKSAYVD